MLRNVSEVKKEKRKRRKKSEDFFLVDCSTVSKYVIDIIVGDIGRIDTRFIIIAIKQLRLPYLPA